VAAIVKNRSEVRKVVVKGSPNYGKEYHYPNESQVYALLQTENGVCGNLALNGDSVLEDLAEFKIYGTRGILEISDVGQFGGLIKLIPNSYEGKKEEIILEPVSGYVENSRGIGPAEMVEAIWDNVKNRASKELAYHVLDVICQIIKSGDTNTFVTVESTCDRPNFFVEKL
jgi:predicted dehydrogenase